MAKLPSFQFYPGDWLRDSVSGCSIAAQGLWLRMLIVAHDGSPYGHLAQGGKALQPEVIARRCGVTLDEYLTLLAELTAAGVPDTSNGSIISRRMVRDQRERDAARIRKQKERGREGDVTPVSRLCHADVTPMSQRSSSSSSSSGICSATPRTREGDDGPLDAVERAMAALRRSTGHDVGANWRHALCTAYSALPGDPVTIHGSEHPSDELWARACEQAASEPGFTPGLPRNFCKYVAGIVQRCRLQGVWPHEHAQADRVFQPTVQVSMSAIEEAAMAKVHQRRAAR